MHLNIDQWPAHAVRVLVFREPVSHIRTQQPNGTSTHLIAKLDQQICCAQSVVTRLRTEPRIPQCT